jgi:hypothetical protein
LQAKSGSGFESKGFSESTAISCPANFMLEDEEIDLKGTRMRLRTESHYSHLSGWLDAKRF